MEQLLVLGVLGTMARGQWLARIFWIVAGADVFLILVALLKLIAEPGSRYDAAFGIVLLGLAGVFGVVMLAFALTRNLVFRGIALAVVTLSMLRFGIPFATDLMTPPIDYDRQPAHLSFDNPADGALADAVAAGDAKLVAERAPAANLNAVGAGDVTFMQMALGRWRTIGPPNPDVVAALLKAGADPAQNTEFVFRVIIERRDLAFLRSVLNAGIDLNQRNYLNQPRFFMLLDWPEGFLLALDHGAAAEAEDGFGKTAIVWAFDAGQWTEVDALLAHGAKPDHADRDGKSFRDAVNAVVDRYRRQNQDVPPRLAELVEKLK